jgi:hypothetical protein
MKKTTLLLAFHIAFVWISNAQNNQLPVDWITPIKALTNNVDSPGAFVYDVEASADGGVYLAVSCTGFCSFAPGVTVVPPVQQRSTVIAKYNSLGDFEWLINLGANRSFRCHISAAPSGGFFLATTFSGSSIKLDSNLTVLGNCTGNFCNSGLVAAFDQNGKALWGEAILGVQSAEFNPQGIEYIGNGQVMVLMEYSSENVTFGSGNSYSDIPAKSIFTATYDALNGEPLTALFPEGDVVYNAQFGSTLASNQLGKQVITGAFNQSITFPNGFNISHDQPGFYKFVAGLNAENEVEWLREISTTGFLVSIYQSAIDADGQVYLAMDMSNNVVLDDQIILEIDQNLAAFVLKLNATQHSVPVFIPYSIPSFEWQIPIADICIAPNGTILTAGYVFDPLTVNGQNIVPAGCYDGLITQTTPDLQTSVARTVGGPDCESYFHPLYFGYGSCLTVDASGNPITAGHFQNSLMADGWSISGTGAFITKFNNLIVSTPTLPTAPLKVFPNPTFGTISLELPQECNLPSLLEISDVRGNIVYSNRINQREIILDVTLQAGIYFLQLRDNTYAYRQKLIISNP